jgi:hypothetical protein
MRAEARRRLQEADPNLTIVSGRRSSKLRRVPRVLSPEEAKEWGLPETGARLVPEDTLAIEALYSKKELEDLCLINYLEPKGDKERLVMKLIYVGVMDNEGNLTEKARVAT